MRRNPRPDGSERAGSRPHETNVLSSIIEYMECVLSLSRSCLFWFFGHWGSEQTKNPTGQKFLVGGGAIRLYTELRCRASMFFLKCLKRHAASPMCKSSTLQMLHCRSGGRGLLFALLRLFR